MTKTNSSLCSTISALDYWQHSTKAMQNDAKPGRLLLCFIFKCCSLVQGVTLLGPARDAQGRNVLLSDVLGGISQFNGSVTQIGAVAIQIDLRNNQTDLTRNDIAADVIITALVCLQQFAPSLSFGSSSGSWPCMIVCKRIPTQHSLLSMTSLQVSHDEIVSSCKSMLFQRTGRI